MWILMRDFAAMRRELKNPLRINASQRAREELRRFHDFSGDDPLGLIRLRLGRRLRASRQFLRRFSTRVKR
jgi:hypothetical protein